jgi:hypothetical protein
MRDMASARDIVSSIISAANKKIQRRRKNQDEIDNSEHDNDKVSTNSLRFIFSVHLLFSIFAQIYINTIFDHSDQNETRLGEFAGDSAKHGLKRTTMFRQRNRADARE